MFYYLLYHFAQRIKKNKHLENALTFPRESCFKQVFLYLFLFNCRIIKLQFCESSTELNYTCIQVTAKAQSVLFIYQ